MGFCFLFWEIWAELSGTLRGKEGASVQDGPGEIGQIPGTPGSRDRPGEQSFFLGVFPRDYFLIPGDFNFIPGDIPGEFSIPGDFVAPPRDYAKWSRD